MTAETQAALSLRGVRKSFGPVIAVAGIDLDIAAGKICGLIGPNGSGKSTLFDCCTGLVRPTAGQVLAGTTDITGWEMARIAREERLLRSFQKAVVFRALTAEENLILAGQMTAFRSLAATFSLGPLAHRRVQALRARAGELLERVGLAHMRHSKAGEMSFGQQKLLQFASMLMPEPRTILLDEPFAGINPVLIERIVENIRAVNREQGVTFVIVEHNIDVLSDLSHRLVVLSRGSILADGNPEDVIRDPRVVEAYLAG
ncbi:MAG: ABC transporter ATP-binding protein [Rhodospirillales bacterium]|nr:ABC transporter ATP-binding protein [Rhodospirillales bacterium]MDE2198166.1 ABC transporter ATP-binding protein [Rhodospirillales bacterium]MDE2573818.1 ABC transporter ATP-binding protein [Rhodospirillales bacterium]